ncbi:rano class II histocompatibility antigen, A beta chain-like [Triplophysa rosa]|uniref:Major histocompatibility complex class II DBB n=1 Tax=Triplophysa rosa TaxID=992332 RepID=A0A9W7WE56_TRIRA|nr:rano class II histocompatibility antigen, A beta chain-like [Triplophysa rosa]KAI7797912.1 putative major histocompatibility complex class II DBB [Triplophysa rosa]
MKKMQYSLVICIAMFLPALFVTVHGHYGYVALLCQELGSLENVEFIFSVYYNKAELLRFNSTENRIVGYTEYAMKWADDLNKKPEWLRKEGSNNVANCKRYGAQFLALVDKAVKPEVTIQSVRQASGTQPAMLICSAYEFYPKFIKMTWMRNDEVMNSDVTSTEELADGDWYYQIHSHLEYFPKPGEKITCVVEHASSNKPMIYHWHSSLPESDRIELFTGAAGFVLGIIMTVGGLIYYLKKHTAHVKAAADQDIRYSRPLQTLDTDGY